MEYTRSSGSGTWNRIAATQSWASRSGGAFESICLKHIAQIKGALGIAGILTDESVWRHVPGKGTPGAQIDLLIDRADHCISVCEMKFSLNTFTIDKRYADELRNKMSVFGDESKTKKTFMLVMVTTFGLKDNTYRNGLVQNEILIDDLFK